MLKVFCPISKGPVITSSNKIINQFEQEVALGKQNVRANCLPKGQAEVYLEPLIGTLLCLCMLVILMPLHCVSRPALIATCALCNYPST